MHLGFTFDPMRPRCYMKLVAACSIIIIEQVRLAFKEQSFFLVDSSIPLGPNADGAHKDSNRCSYPTGQRRQRLSAPTSSKPTPMGAGCRCQRLSGATG